MWPEAPCPEESRTMEHIASYGQHSLLILHRARHDPYPRPLTLQEAPNPERLVPGYMELDSC